MKRIMSIIAVTGLLAAAPAFAGIDVFVDFVALAPVYVTPAPVYVTPAAYRHGEPRWHHRHERFERRHLRERREFREHHGNYDFRDRR